MALSPTVKAYKFNCFTFWTSAQGTDAPHLLEKTLVVEDEQILRKLRICWTEDSEMIRKVVFVAWTET